MNGASQASGSARERSTCASPSTRRRVASPRLPACQTWPISFRNPASTSAYSSGLLDAGQMPGAADQLEPRSRHQIHRLAHQIRRGRSVLGSGDAQHRQAPARRWWCRNRCPRSPPSSRDSPRPAGGSACCASRRIPAVARNRLREPAFEDARRPSPRSRRRGSARCGRPTSPWCRSWRAVFDSTIAATRSGRFTASPCAISPPIDRPTKTASRTSRWSSSRSASATSVPMPIGRGAGVGQAVAALVVADQPQARAAAAAAPCPTAAGRCRASWRTPAACRRGRRFRHMDADIGQFGDLHRFSLQNGRPT